MLNDWQTDLRYAARVLRKSPAFTAVAVATLALSIGLNCALFSVVNAVLFRPLPVPRPAELVTVFNGDGEGLVTHSPLAFPDFQELREQNRSLSGLFGYALDPVALETGDRSQMALGEIATGDYFTTLGVNAVLGRTFTRADEEGPAAAPVVVLGYRAWQRHFGGDPAVVGRSLRLNGSLFTVIGVAPQQFTGLYPLLATDLWMPMRWTGSNRQSDLDDRSGRWLLAMGRLKPGVTLAQAQQEAAAIGANLAREYPETNRTREIALIPLGDVKMAPGIERVLYPASMVLLAVVGLVLLIASANVANMLLARATARRKEFAIRMALGAVRGRLLQQLLVESLLLALAGSAGGLTLALWSNAALLSALSRTRLPVPVTLTLGIALDWRVLAYTVALALLTTLAFGLVPALVASRSQVSSELKEESSGSAGGVRKRRLQGALVVTQVALSLVLLIGAGLSVRSLWNARRIDPGFRIGGVATVTLSPGLSSTGAEANRAFFDSYLQRVRALPGVEAAGLTSQLPLAFGVRTMDVVRDGDQGLPREQRTEIDASSVSSGYFETMGIRIERGRGFQPSDTDPARNLVVVNQTLATRLWPDQDPIGRQVVLPGVEQPWEVIGVAADSKYRSLGEATRPYLYQALQADEYDDGTVVVRAGDDANALLAELRSLARATDQRVPIMNLQTLEEATSVSLLLPRAGAGLFGMFGLLGLVLAAVGLYGVISYLVSQRTREFGIRVTLGAQPFDIAKLALGQGLRLTLIGVAIGVAGAVAVTRVLAVILYGISPTDGATFAAVAGVLVAVALLACHIPARRASRVDPMVALRGD